MTPSGLHYLLNGFKLLTKPGIKRFVIMPLLINISLFIGLFFLANHLITLLNHWLLTLLPSWLQWLSHVVWLFFFIGFILIIVYTFVTIANIISSPFNSLLAEKIELYLTGESLTPQSTWSTIKDIPRVIARQLAIIGYSLPRAIVLLILFFIPIIQLVAALIWFLFNAWLMTLQYIDYPTDNHRIPFKTVQTTISQKSGLSLSFGIATLLFSMIPIINLFVMPAAVAGATQLWLEQFNKHESTF